MTPPRGHESYAVANRRRQGHLRFLTVQPAPAATMNPVEHFIVGVLLAIESWKTRKSTE